MTVSNEFCTLILFEFVCQPNSILNSRIVCCSASTQTYNLETGMQTRVTFQLESRFLHESSIKRDESAEFMGNGSNDGIICELIMIDDKLNAWCLVLGAW